MSDKCLISYRRLPSYQCDQRRDVMKEIHKWAYLDAASLVGAGTGPDSAVTGL